MVYPWFLHDFVLERGSRNGFNAFEINQREGFSHGYLPWCLNAVFFNPWFALNLHAGSLNFMAGHSSCITGAAGAFAAATSLHGHWYDLPSRVTTILRKTCWLLLLSQSIPPSWFSHRYHCLLWWSSAFAAAVSVAGWGKRCIAAASAPLEVGRAAAASKRRWWATSMAMWTERCVEDSKIMPLCTHTKRSLFACDAQSHPYTWVERMVSIPLI